VYGCFRLCVHLVGCGAAAPERCLRVFEGYKQLVLCMPAYVVSCAGFHLPMHAISLTGGAIAVRGHEPEAPSWQVSVLTSQVLYCTVLYPLCRVLSCLP
jgi:hypothetical protein